MYINFFTLFFIVMTIPFLRKAQNGDETEMRFSLFNVLKLDLRTQTNYKARRSKWAQSFADRIVMCADYSFKHK